MIFRCIVIEHAPTISIPPPKSGGDLTPWEAPARQEQIYQLFYHPWWSSYFINIAECGILSFLNAAADILRFAIVFPECDFKMLLSLKVVHSAHHRQDSLPGPAQSPERHDDGGGCCSIKVEKKFRFLPVAPHSSSCVVVEPSRHAWWLFFYSFCCGMMICEKNSSSRGTITRCMRTKTDFHMAANGWLGLLVRSRKEDDQPTLLLTRHTDMFFIECIIWDTT